MYWINFLHIYQPPWQNKENINKITRQCYLPLLELLEKNKSIKIVLNISGSLTELLDKFGYKNLILQIKNLAARSQIEFTGSACYHAFLPLLPKKEIIRQITLNQQINQKYFGKIYKPKGLFSPELSYNFKTAKVAKSLGFKWMLADAISLTKKEKEAEGNTFYKIRGLKNFYVFFPHREFSDQVILFKNSREYFENLKKLAQNANYIITANDGEMYGHHQKKGIDFLRYAYKSNEFSSLTISDLIKLKNKFRIKTVAPCPSTWSTREIHYKKNTPYPLWQDRENKIHYLLWQLANFAIKIVNINKNDKNFYWARKHLDQGLASCTWWWAAGEINWNPEEIEKGLLNIIKSLRSLKELDVKKRTKAEKIYLKIVFEIWRKHWSGEIKKIQKESVLIKKR